MELERSLFAVLLVGMSFLAGCLGTQEGERRNPTSYEPVYVGMSSLVNVSNEFAFDMYAHLVEGDDNVFFSPYSIMIALGMAYEGSRGETRDEIQSVIDLPADNATRRDMVRDLQSQLNPDGANYELSTANAYWLRMGEDLNDDYQSTIENDYLAGGQELDFRGDAAGSADTINKWVEGETNGRIKDLISPALITYYTYLILTNAIYFKANWRWQFDEEATIDRDFRCTDGSVKQVPTMNMCDESFDLNYAENDDVQFLQLPYKDEELSMYILLPRTNNIPSMEQLLSREYVNGLKSDMFGTWVDLYLPKFKMELKYDLNDDLKDMGMPSAFSPSMADFSGIKESGEPVFISQVIHQSFVEVNEEGTEAAAATAVVMTDSAGPGSGSEPEPIEFRADHPFIFFIEHKETGQMLFMGKVEDPNIN